MDIITIYGHYYHIWTYNPRFYSLGASGGGGLTLARRHQLAREAGDHSGDAIVLALLEVEHYGVSPGGRKETGLSIKKRLESLTAERSVPISNELSRWASPHQPQALSP